MDKRKHILDAAERVLQSKGLSGATTRAITTEAGCAEGTLYLYFKGRAELFLAIFERRLNSAFPNFDLLEGADKGAGPHAVLLDVGLKFLRFHRQAAPLLASLFAEPVLLKKYRALILSRSPDTPRASPNVVAYLRRLRREKTIARDTDPAMVAEAFLGACFARAFHDSMFDDRPSDAADRKFLRALIDSLIS
jgi:AcrR family transcriptional regulator